MPKPSPAPKGSSPKATKLDTKQSLSAVLSTSSSQHLSTISGSTPSTNPPTEPRTPTPSRIKTTTGHHTPLSGLGSSLGTSGASASSSAEVDSPSPTRPRRHIVRRTPEASKEASKAPPSPSGSQSPSPPPAARQNHGRHVFNSTTPPLRASPHASPTRTPSPNLGQHQHAPAEVSTGALQSPRRPSSPGASTPNETEADGLRQKAPSFSTFNPIARPECSRNGALTSHASWQE